MESTPQSQPQDPWQNKTALELAFKEYQFLSEATDKITDRRQTVNTLFVTINALFLTGVGYLMLQYLQDIRQAPLAPLFLAGFLAIAIVTLIINRAWLRLSESNRRLVDLRIRYLKQLEKKLRHGGAFPELEVPLMKDEVRGNGAHVGTTRGVYTLEDVLYNPGVAQEQFGFSRAEQRVGATFTVSYWLAFAAAVIAYVVITVLPQYVPSFPHL